MMNVLENQVTFSQEMLLLHKMPFYISDEYKVILLKFLNHVLQLFKILNQAFAKIMNLQ